MIVSRLPTLHPQTVLKEADDLVILGVTFDSNMTFSEASSLGFHSYFSNTWYLEEVLMTIL